MYIILKNIKMEDQCLYDNELHTIGETTTKTNDVCRQCTCYGNGGRSVTMNCTETNCTWGPNGNSFTYHVSKYLIIHHFNILENNVISPFVISTSDFGHREVVVATCINQNK
jgi:hypothetical protein